MLLGENFGRCHDRCLVAGLHRRAHRQRRHDRLARADVALQQAMHRIGRRHVGADLVPHALLRAGEREAETLAQARDERSSRPHREAPGSRRPRAQDGEPELEQQEVVEGEPAHRALTLGVGGREMRLPHRLRQRRQPATHARGLGQRLLDGGAELLDHLPHQATQRALRQSFGRGVHRHETAGVQVLVVAALHQLPVLHGDGDLVAIAADLAVQHEALAARQHARQVVTTREQRRRRIPAFVAQEQRERRATASGRRRADAGDDAGAGRRLADAERRQRCEPRAIFVADGHEEQRVADGLESLSPQQLGALGSDALQELQWRGESGRRARLPGPGHCVNKSACLCGWEPILKES